MTSSGDAPLDPAELDIGPRAVIAARYEILSPLGAGGMGWVFKARDRILGETVALKVLRSDLELDAERTERFRSEIRFARRVRHRNVCGLHEYGEDGNLHYIAMEYVEGSDLKQIVEEDGPLPWGEAYTAAIQAAEGLNAIHEMGIIHRDIKTANITRDREGVIRLMDFGIAMEGWGSGGAGLPGANPVMGTPEYMSPEQVRGQAIDFRSDLYAMGVVIYELFTGRVPFQGETPLATMLKHFADQPSFSGPAGELIPRPLVPVLQRALAKQPEGRPDSAREMVDALKEAQRATPLEPLAPATRTDGPKPRRRGPTTDTLEPLPSVLQFLPKRSLERIKLEDETRGPRPPLSSLLAALSHADRDVRAGAAHGLGRLGPDAVGAVPSLVRALADPAGAVRAQVAHALRRIGPAAMGAVVPLIGTMKDEHGYVRDAAAWAVAELTALPVPPGRLPPSFLRTPTAPDNTTLDTSPRVATTDGRGQATSRIREPRSAPPAGWRSPRPKVSRGLAALLVLLFAAGGITLWRSVGRPGTTTPNGTGSTATSRETHPLGGHERRRTPAGNAGPRTEGATSRAAPPEDAIGGTGAEVNEPGATNPANQARASAIPFGALVDLSEPGLVPPVPILAPRPHRPEGGHGNERSASVEVRLLVDEEGKVTAVEWVSGPGEWRASVAADLRQWSYRPASLQGVPVKVYLSLSFVFTAG